MFSYIKHTALVYYSLPNSFGIGALYSHFLKAQEKLTSSPRVAYTTQVA